ncbi:MAG: c-type cytochrome [Myxococcota bacterium]
MRLGLTALAIGGLVACGSSDPAPVEAPAEPSAAAPKVEEPKVEAPKEDPLAAFNALSDDDKKAELMTLGKTVYETGGSGGLACQTCHQAGGEGLPPTYPPLAGALEFMGDCGTHAGYVINGLNGEIEVLGKTYNGAMPAQGNLSDLEIAAVITYERNSWGNESPMCTPDMVAAAR